MPDSVPLKVVVTRVSGTLPAASRPALEANVGRTVSAYVDAAFLGGAYPRSDFSGSFGAFTPGAAKDARRDQGLLTNAAFGPSTESVRATRRTAYLSVLAPYKVAAGVTAEGRPGLLVDRGDRPAQRVQLTGRLLLTRDRRRRRWAVFGYDLAVRRRKGPQECHAAAPPWRAAPRPGARPGAGRSPPWWCPTPRSGTADTALVRVRTAQAVDHPRTWSGSSASARTPARASG